MTKHFASGDVNDQGMDAAASAAGFNMADVNDAETLHALPSGVQGLYFLNEAKGVTSSFVSQMNAIKGSANLFGVYLADEPDPSNVSAATLKAESDWIHANMPGVKTFIVADNQGSNSNPDFHNYYTQASTHIDLWGLDVYPFRTEVSGAADVTEVDRTVAAAKSQIGITTEQIVPVFQAFGGGNYPDGDGGKWAMPTPAQEKALMAEWQKFAPNPAFDYAYSWAQQEGDNPLSANAALIDVFKQHNSAASATPSPTPTPTPVTPAPDPTSGTGGSGANTGHHHHGSGRHSGQHTVVAKSGAAALSAAHADTFAFTDLKSSASANGVNHPSSAGVSGTDSHPGDQQGGSSAHLPVHEASSAPHDWHAEHAGSAHSHTLNFHDHHLV